MTRAPIDVVLPVHNEELSIERVLREFYEVVAVRRQTPVHFVVCEDGSSDGTVQVLERLAGELPLTLITSPKRKGYSQAVIDGLGATQAELVSFIDSDGQCDPLDFELLRTTLESSPQCDIAIGFRHARQDSLYRKAMSRAFRTVYRALFPVRLKDPSCPYLIIRRPALQSILTGSPGRLHQGFWWEFNARAAYHRLHVVEVPVSHRARLEGDTQVYRPTKIPQIAVRHLRGLVKLRRELSNVPELASAEVAGARE